MSERDERHPDRADTPEADPQEQAIEDASDEVPSTDSAEVPEADALEQSTPLRPSGDDRPRIKDDVPEADAIEQAQTAVPDDSDEY
jgi:hypothetical protein